MPVASPAYLAIAVKARASRGRRPRERARPVYPGKRLDEPLGFGLVVLFVVVFCSSAQSATTSGRHGASEMARARPMPDHHAGQPWALQGGALRSSRGGTANAESEFEPVISEPTLLGRLGVGRREGFGLRRLVHVRPPVSVGPADRTVDRLAEYLPVGWIVVVLAFVRPLAQNGPRVDAGRVAV